MPAKKRATYGEGSVYQRASDGRWVAKLQAGWNPTGTRRTITRVARTEAEAKRKLRDLKRDIATEGIPVAGVSRATVKTWADEWLPIHARKVRPKAYETDAGLIRKWVVPTIGHRRLTDLTPGDVRSLHTAITRAGLTTTTARAGHWALMGMLKAAILDGHAVPQRVLLVEAPPKAVNDRDAIPLVDALRILEVAAGRHDSARWVAALLQGMRQGECLGLTRECVDFTPRDGAPFGVIDVSWQLQSLPYIDRKNKALGFRVPDAFEARHLTHAYHLIRPKTARGRRIIPLVQWMASALTDILARPEHNPWGLIWTGEDNRPGRSTVTPMRARVDREAWYDLQAHAGVAHPSGRPYGLHEARHTCATLLLEAGVDPHTVTAIMGHSSIVVSRSYQHAGHDLTRKALEGVAARLNLGP